MATEMLTVLTPIVPGREAELRAVLGGLDVTAPFARVPGTHVARLLVMDWLGGRDPVHRRRLRPSPLSFSAVVDGPVPDWLPGLRAGLGDVADDVWSHCLGWPGPVAAAGAAFDRWLLAHRLDLTMPFVAFPDTPADDILHALDVRERLAHLAVSARDLPPGKLRLAFAEAFGRSVPSS